MTRIKAISVAVVAVGILAAVSAARATGTVSVEASIDNRRLGDATESRPIKLNPAKPANLAVAIRNDGDAPVLVHTVRLEGRVLGLTFYAYDTTVAMRVAAHSRETRTIVLDLAGLQGQATGLIPSHVLVLDGSRHVLAGQKTIVDVRGSVKSVYGAFGLALMIATGVSLVSALLALALGRLHANRIRRALRFLVPGTGTGLVLLFSLSAFRVLAPLASRSIPCIVGSSLVFFMLGFLTPTPDADTDDDDDEDEEAARPERLAVGAASAPGGAPLASTPAPPTIAPRQTAPADEQ